MIRTLFIVALLSLSHAAFGQGILYHDSITDSQGQLVTNATVRVCESRSTETPCLPLAKIYSDTALTAEANNPFVSTDGKISFYIGASCFDLEVSGGTIATYTLRNLCAANGYIGQMRHTFKLWMSLSPGCCGSAEFVRSDAPGRSELLIMPNGHADTQSAELTLSNLDMDDPRVTGAEVFVLRTAGDAYVIDSIASGTGIRRPIWIQAPYARFTDPVRFDLGSAQTPAITFNGYLDTGLYFDSNSGRPCVTNGGTVVACFDNVNGYMSSKPISAGGGSANKVVCWKDDGTSLGYCSTQPAINGSCTCK